MIKHTYIFIILVLGKLHNDSICVYIVKRSPQQFQITTITTQSYKFFSCEKNFEDLLSWQLANIQYSIINSIGTMLYVTVLILYLKVHTFQPSSPISPTPYILCIFSQNITTCIIYSLQSVLFPRKSVFCPIKHSTQQQTVITGFCYGDFLFSTNSQVLF